MAIALEERPRESEPDIRLPKGPMWITPRVTDISPLSPAVDEYLIDHRSELVDFAETLVSFDTQNPPGRTVEVTEWLESVLAGTSLAVNRIEVDPEKPNLVATLAGASDRTLCFNGHLDTVPFDRSDWSRDLSVSGSMTASTAAARPI